MAHRRLPVVFVLALLAIVLSAPAAHAQDAGWRADTPYGIHSMLYTTSPYGFKRAIFAQTAASGASTIRLDLAVNAVWSGGSRISPPDWTDVDQIMALSREYGIRVSAVVVGMPWGLQKCPPGTEQARRMYCPPDDPEEYARMIREIARHTAGTIDTFEIGNEPDGVWNYLGTAEDYAWTLSRAYDAIKLVNPGARVALAGMTGTYSMPFLDKVLATPGADVRDKFDIANIHVRGSLAGVKTQISRWKGYFAWYGIDRPLWVTEHGYPSDPHYQRDRHYRKGERSQADYLIASTQAMLRAGVAKIFITGRDNMDGQFASEGILGGQVSDPAPADPQIRRKRAFVAFQKVAFRGAWAKPAMAPRTQPQR